MPGRSVSDRVSPFLGTLLFLLVAGVASAEDGLSQLQLDHAVAGSEHIVRGSYDAGVLTVEKELKGKLATPGRLSLERDEVELKDDDLVPGTPHMKGKGVFFLVARFDGRGEDTRRFMEWGNVEGVAWEGTVSFLGYRPATDDRFRIIDLAARDAFEKLLASSLERQASLDKALAAVDTKTKAEALAGIVATVRDGPASVTSELGPDPFAARAITEIGNLGEVATLEKLRKDARQGWIKAASIRAMAAVEGNVSKIEQIALDPDAGEDEVVAAIDMLFATEKAGVATLEKLSWDARPRVRRAVAAALREKVTDLKTLERLMGDHDPSVKAAATDSARAAARRLGLPLPGDDEGR